MARVDPRKEAAARGPVQKSEGNEEEAEALAKGAAAATDVHGGVEGPVVEPEEDRSFEPPSKQRIPDDVWHNQSPDEIRMNIGRPVRIHAGQKVRIISTLRRAVRNKCGTFVDPDTGEEKRRMKLVSGEDITGMLPDDERLMMDVKEPELDPTQ